MYDPKYGRALTLCIESMNVLCCEAGDLRSRLSMIDMEFYLLELGDIPDFDGLREDFEALRISVTKLKPKNDEGRIKATLSRSQWKTLKGVAQLIWGIHRKFGTFMNTSD